MENHQADSALVDAVTAEPGDKWAETVAGQEVEPVLLTRFIELGSVG